MDTMQELGRDKALQHLQELTRSHGTCEHCKKEKTLFTYPDYYSQCMPCYVADLQYWENRIGAPSEYVFYNTLPPSEDAQRVAMSAYFGTLLEEGNR